MGMANWMLQPLSTQKKTLGRSQNPSGRCGEDENPKSRRGIRDPIVQPGTRRFIT
jgi:hypothetical protein